jgi:hypothetical protein
MVLDLSPELADCVDAMRARLGATDRVEVFRNAVAVYEYLLKAHQDGLQVLVRDPVTGDERRVAVTPNDTEP